METGIAQPLHIRDYESLPTYEHAYPKFVHPNFVHSVQKTTLFTYLPVLLPDWCYENLSNRHFTENSFRFYQKFDSLKFRLVELTIRRMSPAGLGLVSPPGLG